MTRIRRMMVTGAMLLAGVLPAAAQTGPATLPPTAGLGAGPGAAPPQAQEPPFTMNLGARVQVRYTYLDPEEARAVGSFGIRRARLSLSGAAYQRFDYALQVELAGGAARLLDANIRYSLAPMATLWIGQGKAGFGRQQLTSSGNLQMVDRAITDARFAAGRQQGLALTGQTTGRTFEYSAGIYNGNGINASNANDRYMLVGRAVWTPMGAYALSEAALDNPASPRLALGVAGLHNTLGHDQEELEVARLGLEAAFKVRWLSAVGEVYWERATPVAADRLITDGWYLQAGYLLPGRRHELAGRYAVIRPDTPLDTSTVETGLGYSLYLNGHRAKLQADLRNLERREAGANDVELRVQFQLAM